MLLTCIVIPICDFMSRMCSYLFDRKSSNDEDMAEGSSAPDTYAESEPSSQCCHPDQSLEDSQGFHPEPSHEDSQDFNDSTMNWCASEDDNEDGDILGIEAEEVVKDNVNLINEAKEKIDSASLELEKHRQNGKLCPVCVKSSSTAFYL